MQPRGIRNNNPLNIKIGNDWLGERPNNDGVFEEFEKMEYGVRAAVIILRRYIIKYGRNNLRKIIHSWSPDGETAERAYLQSVSQWCNLPLDSPINFNDADLMCKIIQGMARVENGQVVDINIIRRGYEMACDRLPMS